VVNTGSAAEAFSIRNYLHNQWQDLLLPPFEKAFDEAASAEHIIHFPRIEFRLQVASEKQLTEMLPDLIHQQLGEQLQFMLRENLQPNSQSVLWKESTVQQSQFDSLIYYLRSGSVPWQAVNALTSETAIQLKETCRQQWSQLLDYLRNKNETASFYFRLLQLISEENSTTLLSVLSDTIPHPWATAVVQFITALLVSGQKFFKRYTQLQLVAALLSESLRKRESNVAPDFASITESVLAQEEKNRLDDFIASLPVSAAVLLQRDKISGSKVAADSSTDTVSRITEVTETITEVTETNPSLSTSTSGVFQQKTGHHHRLIHSNPQESQLANVDSPVGRNKAATPAVSGNASGAGNAPLNAPLIPAYSSYDRDDDHDLKEANHLFDGINQARTDTEPGLLQGEISQTPFPFPMEYPVHDKPAEPEFPLLVNHAGLILLHPFISRFFENTGIKKIGMAQLSSSVTARAAALLHFLATGQEEVYEYELGFIKVLLGLEPATPLLVAEGLVQPDDKEEAEAVLQSIISYWTILKNTSVQGLRSSFLQRQGLLREDDNGWRLQVEPMPFDMLLERLPWGIGIVKLPWMQQAIYTEWPTP
jgi:CRP-like cAMP-binding protein